MTKLTGSCLCGSVTYEAEGDIAMSGDCYCTDCRKSSGTAHSTHFALPDNKFSFAGEVATYDRPADSGHVVSRSFCPSCGSPLFSRNEAMPGMVFLRASCLDDLDVAAPAMTVYASRAPKWAQINHENPVLDEMPEGGPPTSLD